jgi:hypothetical protein
MVSRVGWMASSGSFYASVEPASCRHAGLGRPLTSHKPTYMRLSGHSILAVPGSGCTFNCGPIATRLKAVE